MRLRATVICYHAVGDCPRESDPNGLFVGTRAFEAQMNFLARRRNVVSLPDLLAGEVSESRPAVAITFDDAYANVLTVAAPILARYGFPATVFVPTKWIGARHTWDSDGISSGSGLSVMSTEELLEAELRGLSVESHGHEHIDLLESDEDSARRDFRTSIEILTSLLGRRPRYLAYPYGRSTPVLQKVAEEAGFEAAFTVNPYHGEGRFALERVSVWPTDSRIFFALKTSGHYLSLRRSAFGRAGYAVVRPLLRRTQVASEVD